MDKENGIIAEWISPCKLKRYVALDISILGLLGFVRLIALFHRGYELSKEVFLDGGFGEAILNSIFLIGGGLSFILGLAMTALGLLGIGAEIDRRRVVTLLLMGNINMITAILLIIK